jgi:hypothetical protein
MRLGIAARWLAPSLASHTHPAGVRPGIFGIGFAGADSRRDSGRRDALESLARPSEHHGFAAFVSGPVIPLWLASVTSFFLTYGFGLALVAGFDFYRRLRDAQLHTAALERSLNAAHLAALRMQLSPHTLFNLLHTIRGQIDWDPVAAQSMVVQLADLLRRLLKAGERELSRLCDELQFVRLYLDLQQKRFSDRLTVRVPAQDTLPRHGCRV